MKITSDWAGISLMLLILSPGISLAQQTPENAVTVISTPEANIGRTEEEIAKIKAIRASAEKAKEQGQAYLKAGKYQEAVVAFQESLALVHTSSRPYLGLIEAYRELKQFDKAIETYRKLLYPWEGKNFASHENNPYVLLPFAQLLNQRNKWAEAVSVYNHALNFLDEKSERRALSTYNLPVWQAFSPTMPEKRRFEAAVRVAQALVHCRRGEEEQALSELQRALELQPRDAYAHYYIARLLKHKVGSDAMLRHFALAERYGDAAVRQAVSEAIALLHYMYQEQYPEVKRTARLDP
jgi:tetratricopeptide (TPR) repeat protein